MAIESCPLAKHSLEEHVEEVFILSTASKDAIPLNQVWIKLRELFWQEEERWKRADEAKL
ncbi:hypothetical protein ACLOJK_006771 [Asimina triloba]